MNNKPSFIYWRAWKKNTFNPAITEKGGFPAILRKEFISCLLPALINRIRAFTKLFLQKPVEIIFTIQKTQKIITNLLIGAGCCVLLSGCETKKPAGPPEKVTIAIPKNMGSVLEKIAEAKGFFRQEGLDVTLQVHSFGKAALQSVLDGKADLATAADTPIMFAMMEGAKLSLLATIQTSTKDNAIVARKDRGVSSVTDLMGRRVGVSLGTNGDYFLDTYLVLNALSRKDVVIVDMKPEDMTDALLRRKVDAVSTWNPLVSNLGKALGDRGITFFNESAYKETFNVVSMPTFPRQRSEAIRRFLRALVKAEDFVAANPQESQRIISEFCSIDIASLARIWNDFQFNISLNQSLLVTLEDQARWAIKNGLTNRRDLPNFFEALYIDGLKTVKPDTVRVIR
jgi:NitT/TauT family transport system substrate-binding protein